MWWPVVVSFAPPCAAPTAGSAPAMTEKNKDKKEDSDESDDDMSFALFDYIFASCK